MGATKSRCCGSAIWKAKNDPTQSYSDDNASSNSSERKRRKRRKKLRKKRKKKRKQKKLKKKISELQENFNLTTIQTAQKYTQQTTPNIIPYNDYQQQSSPINTHPILQSNTMSNMSFISNLSTVEPMTNNNEIINFIPTTNTPTVISKTSTGSVIINKINRSNSKTLTKSDVMDLSRTNIKDVEDRVRRVSQIGLDFSKVYGGDNNDEIDNSPIKMKSDIVNDDDSDSVLSENALREIRKAKKLLKNNQKNNNNAEDDEFHTDFENDDDDERTNDETDNDNKNDKIGNIGSELKKTDTPHGMLIRDKSSMNWSNNDIEVQGAEMAQHLLLLQQNSLKKMND